MIDLAGEQCLTFLGLLAVGDVHGDAADPHHAARRIEARRRGAASTSAPRRSGA